MLDKKQYEEIVACKQLSVRVSNFLFDFETKIPYKNYLQEKNICNVSQNFMALWISTNIT